MNALESARHTEKNRSSRNTEGSDHHLSSPDRCVRSDRFSDRGIEGRVQDPRYFLRPIRKFQREVSHQRAESKQKEILVLQEEAQKQIEERGRLLNASEEDFTHALSKFDGYLVQVLRIKDSLERELASVTGNNRIYREGRIKGMNQRVSKS